MSDPLRFEVVAGDTVIGHSALEHGDPPMGVTHGRLHVTPAYASRQAGTPLRVRPIDGEFFEPEGGVHTEDFSAELDEIEVSVLGIASAVYERYFPHHVKAYEDSFK
jgi:hypothetical protein